MENTLNSQSSLMLICPVAELERMTSESVATRLTLSLTTSRGIQCDRSARYKDKGVLQTLVIDLIYVVV